MSEQTLYEWLPKTLRNERKLWRYFSEPVIYAPKRLHPNPITSLDAIFASAERWCVFPGKVLAVSKTDFKMKRLTAQMVWEFKIPFEVLGRKPRQCLLDTLPIVDIAKSRS